MVAGAPAASAPARLHGLVSALGFEAPLLEELGRAPALGPRWPALLTVEAGSLAAPDPVFALQQLPEARQVRGPSVSALAEESFLATDAVLEADAGPFTLHAYVPSPRAYRGLEARARLVADTWLGLVKARRRRAFRRFVPWEQAAAAGPALLVVQLVPCGRTSLLVSAARPRPLPSGGFDIAPWPAGVAPIAEDRAAPSRAYRKLCEAFAWMGEGPVAGQRCVDLGGAPGGWAWTALARGAQVTAVDRAPLAPAVARHERLEAILGNAFTYAPGAPVDWLLCDVICEPARTVDLCERWMTGGLCRRVVATLKFKGNLNYGEVAAARARLGRLGWRFLRLKHLACHHNEVALMAAR